MPSRYKPLCALLALLALCLPSHAQSAPPGAGSRPRGTVIRVSEVQSEAHIGVSAQVVDPADPERPPLPPFSVGPFVGIRFSQDEKTVLVGRRAVRVLTVWPEGI